MIWWKKKERKKERKKDEDWSCNWLFRHQLEAGTIHRRNRLELVISFGSDYVKLKRQF